MRVIQLIDSLQPGGAERMAVMLANELSMVINKSFLCSTREEGLLLDTINENVSYLYLKKKGTLDLAAFRRLFIFISKNNIDIIHAHSSSFFIATVIKLFRPKIKVIWHDHYGYRKNENIRKYKVLRWCSKKFCAIITVSADLKIWAEKHLKTKKVYFLNNFVSQKIVFKREVFLKGHGGFRIICLANLRPQKDHMNLLKAFRLVKNQYNLASLHLVGEIHKDTYYKSLLSFIRDNNLEDVYFYGVQKDTLGLMKDAKIGVLSSMSEGLPMSLLEYGLANLPVVSTDVGQCKEVINDHGLVISPGNAESLASALLKYIENPMKRKEDALAFSNHIRSKYTFQAVQSKILSLYKLESY
jgi:glycosyltransferase involved in cell wall biosynthesis